MVIKTKTDSNRAENQPSIGSNKTKSYLNPNKRLRPNSTASSSMKSAPRISYFCECECKPRTPQIIPSIILRNPSV